MLSLPVGNAGGHLQEKNINSRRDAPLRQYPIPQTLSALPVAASFRFLFIDPAPFVLTGCRNLMAAGMRRCG